jgi:D-alanyl-lipoteichoic acid acyltransferase DltB (MBOAT superfamily)
MDTMPLLAGLLAYVVLARFTIRLLSGSFREFIFAVLNLAGVFFFLFYGGKEHFVFRFGTYVGLVFGLYLLILLFAARRGTWPWLAFFGPIVALIVVRYVPPSFYVALGHALGKSWRGPPNMIGISYLAFRCSRLVLEVRNGLVKQPRFLEYLNFAFFLPTMPVGPINTYGNFRRGFEATPYVVPVGRAALRILVGAVKYQFLGNLCAQLNYSGLLLDDHPHHWLDLPVAMVFYYLFLYLNFSGFCDMAIGSAALIGIPVPENFDNPFAARNVRDFWNRWHITLSLWMRDVVFSPLSKFLVGLFGIQRADHAIALAITIVFLLVGIWHGVGWNFAAFGAMHALGVVANHYYTIFLKRRLGRDGFKAYNSNGCIHASAMGLTFFYCAASFLLFANSFADMQRLLAAFR